MGVAEFSFTLGGAQGTVKRLRAPVNIDAAAAGAAAARLSGRRRHVDPVAEPAAPFASS
jgi:hypothetical protein